MTNPTQQPKGTLSQQVIADTRVPSVLTDAKVRAIAVCDGGGYQDDKTADWEFTDAGLQKFARVLLAQSAAAASKDRRDAERYRWLRHALSDDSKRGVSHHFCNIQLGHPEILDEDIDAALSKENFHER